MSRIYPVILAGGKGTRLWPLSCDGRPKPCVPIDGPSTFLQNTLERMAHPAYEPAVVVCHRSVAGSFEDLALSAGFCIGEQEGRGTAFATAIAALYVREQNPDALMLVLPCDHHIEDPGSLHKAISDAVPLAESGNIIMLGITPVSSDTRYGYIRYEKGGHAVSFYPVTVFAEKPAQAEAESLLKDGQCLWNSGIFLSRANTVLDEIEALAPAVYKSALDEWHRAEKDDRRAWLNAVEEGEACLSFDGAVLEKTKKALVVPVNMGWKDLGTWQSLWEHLPRDGQGNALHGAASIREAASCLIYNDTGMKVTAEGVEDLVIVVSGTDILVKKRETAG